MSGYDESLELTDLMEALFEGAIKPEEAARLEQIVAGSESARQHFLDCVWVHGELHWQITKGDDAVGGRDPFNLQPNLRGEQTTLARPRPRSRPRPRPRPAPFRPPRMSRWPSAVLASPWLAIGLSLLLFVVCLHLAGVGPLELGPLAKRLVLDKWPSFKPPSFNGPSADYSTEGVQIAATADAQWSEGGAPNADGRVALGETLTLRQGLAAVVFPSGTRMILEGPAILESLSARKAKLSEGQLTARVPPEAVGFTIETPDARVVDLGTEFSVAVEKAKWTEVEVVSGNVEVSPAPVPTSGSPAEWSRKLAVGEAVRVVSSATGGKTQIQSIPFGSRQYAREVR